MRGQEEFLWGGLRTRLERSGAVRPQTVRMTPIVGRPEPKKSEATAAFRQEFAALHARVR